MSLCGCEVVCNVVVWMCFVRQVGRRVATRLSLHCSYNVVVVIAHHTVGAWCGCQPLDDVEWAWSFADEVACQQYVVCAGCDGGRCDELLQLVVAAVDVADEEYAVVGLDFGECAVVWGVGDGGGGG